MASRRFVPTSMDELLRACSGGRLEHADLTPLFRERHRLSFVMPGFRIADIKLSGVTLERPVFSDQEISRCDFSRNTWISSQIINCVMSELDMSDSRLLLARLPPGHNPQIEGGRIMRSNLVRMSLYTAEFDEFVIEKCDMTATRLFGCQSHSLFAVKSSLKSAVVSGCALSGVTLRDVDLRAARFKTTDLRYVHMIECDLSNCTFSNTSFLDPKIDHCQAERAQFRMCKVHGGEHIFYNSNLQDTFWRGGEMSGVWLNCDLRGSYFEGCQLKTCDFVNCDLRDSVWEGCHLHRVSFSGGSDEPELRGCVRTE